MNSTEFRTSSKKTPFTDYSEITNYLYLSSFPRGHHAQEIEELGIRLILSMHYRRPSDLLDQHPVRVLWLPAIDHPWTPVPMRHLRRGVAAALPVIRDGGKVLVHCKYGVHRSVVMTACVLISMGYSAEAAMRLIKERRSVARPYTWYVKARIEKFEREWLTKGGEK